MSGATTHVPWASRAFDLAVFAAGLVVAAVAVWSVLPASDDLQLQPLLVVPLVALMASYPIVLTRHEEGIEVGFDSALLVFLLCTTRPDQALVVWCLGVAVAQLTQPKRAQVRLFNTGLGAVAGALTLVTMTSVAGLGGELGNPSARQLLAVIAGCAAYFVVDYVVSVVSISLEQGTPVVSLLVQKSFPLALGLFVAIDTLGYLGALVQRAYGWSFSPLLAVPLTAILVATRALARGHEAQRRLSALFDAAAAVQGKHSRDELVAALDQHARRVVVSGRAGLRTDPAGQDEIGARVRSGAGDLWVVAPARDRARSTVRADQLALEALAAVGEEGFARLGLVDEMQRRARHDALTGLANRTLFLDRVEQAVALGRRGGPRLAVLFLDLDGFKAVNDRFGHDAGDELLVVVAGRLAGCLREGDSVARFGGDEFAVLLHDIDKPGQVEYVCRRILAALRPVVLVNGHEVVVEASIGVAVATADDDADDLLHNADMAMYRAKTLGKSRFTIYQPELRAENIRRLELIERLRRGLADELVVHYQPVVDLASGVVTGLEALVRWERDGRLVSPDAFIAVAEQSGLVVELGERVLQQVVRDAEMLTAAAGRPLALGVNVSAHQLREPSFREAVATACAALAGSTLVLEMTETVLIGDDEETLSTLAQLAASGATLAIDDFGVGFSSVGYLQHMPVDVLKIDRSFTADIDSDDRAEALVRAMVLMGAALGLRVVAEGIERPEQLDRVRSMGCAAGQGYLFSPPRPLPEIAAMLAAGGPEAGAGAAHLKAAATPVR